MYNDKNFKLFSENLIEIALKTGRSIGDSKKHNLIYKMVIPSPENGFPFIAISNSYFVVNTS